MATFADVLSGIADPVTDAMRGLVDVYAEVEAIKVRRAINEANLAELSAGNPTQYQNPQAKAASVTATPGAAVTWGGLALALGVSAVALFLIVKR